MKSEAHLELFTEFVLIGNMALIGLALIKVTYNQLMWITSCLKRVPRKEKAPKSAPHFCKQISSKEFDRQKGEFTRKMIEKLQKSDDYQYYAVNSKKFESPEKHQGASKHDHDLRIRSASTMVSNAKPL